MTQPYESIQILLDDFALIVQAEEQELPTLLLWYQID